MAKTSGGGRARTTEKSLRLVDALHQKGGAGITELSNELDMAKSTVHNHINTLRDCGFVVKSGTDYRLGLRFLGIGGRVRSRMDIYQSAKSEVQKLSGSTGLKVLLTTEESGEGVVLIHADPTAETPESHTGKRFSLLNTLEGRAMLSNLPDARIKELVSDSSNEDASDIMDELAEIRESGVRARASQSGEPRRFTTPIHDGHENVFGALTVAESQSTLGARPDEELIDLVKSTAHRIKSNSELAWYGSEEVVTPKHSLSTYVNNPASKYSEDEL